MSGTRCLIATWPCGCIGAVASLAWDMPAADQARFYREHVEDGAFVENVTRDEYLARGGIVMCKHDPKWGGVESKYGDCPECHKRVLKKRDGALRAHDRWRGWKCDQRVAS